MARTIELEPYNDVWPKLYEAEARNLNRLLGDNVVAIYHIGSTAIIGIKAKATIDILIEVRDIQQIDGAVIKLGELSYVPKGEYGIKGRRFFHKGDDDRTSHIHIYETGHAEIKRHVKFVEFLNSHPDLAKQYENLKISLAKKYKTSPSDYANGKSGFIKRIDIAASQWEGC